MLFSEETLQLQNIQKISDESWFPVRVNNFISSNKVVQILSTGS